MGGISFALYSYIAKKDIFVDSVNRRFIDAYGYQDH
jgi:hypothetical protein